MTPVQFQILHILFRVRCVGGYRATDLFAKVFVRGRRRFGAFQRELEALLKIRYVKQDRLGYYTLTERAIFLFEEGFFDE